MQEIKNGIDRTHLKELVVNRNLKIKNLYCYKNCLKNLDLSNNTELVEISCVDNNLENIDVCCNKKLKLLLCDNGISPYFGDNEMLLDDYKWMNEEGEPIETHFTCYYR